MAAAHHTPTITIKYGGRRLTRINGLWFYLGGNGFKRVFETKQLAREFIRYLNACYNTSIH